MSVNCIRLNNIHTLCKVCLQKKEKSFPLLSIVRYKDLNVPPITIKTMLSRVVSTTEIDDNDDKRFPSLLCLDCLADLKNAYILILKYEEAVKLLQSVFNSTKIKNKCTEEIPQATPNNNDNKKKGKTRKKSVDIEYLNNSNDLVEEKPLPHVCPICPLEYPTAIELVKHAHTHRTLKKYFNIPQEHLISKNSKIYTIPNPNKTTIFNNEVILHECIYCNKGFSGAEFALHLDHHRKYDEFKCDKCNRIFRKLNHLNNHKVKHIKEHPYKCEQCGKGFIVKNNYDCHILTHNNDELPHQCQYCSKRFSNPEHLYRHQLIHTENVTYAVKYKVCRCNQCLKSFRDKTALKKHQCTPFKPKQPVNTNKYTCKICNKVFKNYSGLYNHARNIHQAISRKKLCSVCGRCVSNLYYHMMRHNGDKRYKCDQCDKKFFAKPQLKQHLLVHSGLKPFVCHHCGKAFNNIYNLQVHERIHTGDKKHKCPICDRGFLEKSYLKKHMQVHYKI